MSLLDDPTHWRNRAAEARAIAAEMKDPEAKRTMTEIATHYDVLVERAARRDERSATPTLSPALVPAAARRPARGRRPFAPANQR